MAAFKDPYADDVKAFKDPYADDLAPNPAQDFVKQFGSGLVAGVEGIPAFPARAANFAADLLEPAYEKAIGALPSWLGGGPETVAAIQEKEKRRKEFMANAGTQGIASMLPEPQTTAGKFGRTIGETIPGFVAGTRGPVLGAATGQQAAQALFGRAAPAAVTRGAGVSIPQAVAAGATAGLASEAAGQATEGTKYEPFARVGASLVGGTVALRQAEAAAARRAIPTIEANETAAGRLYDQFRSSNISYNPTIPPKFSDAIKTELQNRGLTDSADIASGTWGALARRLETGAPVTPQNFHTLYQELGHIASGSQIKSQRTAASLAQERLLQFMEQTPQGALTGNVNAPAQAVDALREANALWATAQRARTVSQRIVKSEDKAGSTFSGLNLENELRRRLGALADPDLARRSGYSVPEQAALRRFGQGTFGPNTLRFTGNVLSGGGGVGMLATGAAGVGAGGGLSYLTGGDPATGALAGSLLPLAGLGLRMGSNRWALARAKELENMLLARSPLAANVGNYSQPSAPFIGAGLSAPLQLTVRPGDRDPTLATLGE